MKKLILLLTLAFVMCGCRYIPNEPHSVVTKVKKARDRLYNHKYKYVIITDNGTRFYTDEIFNVGDTVVIKNKNQSRQ